MEQRLSFGAILKRVGGISAMVRLLGYPINRYTIEKWRRQKEIPEQYRAKVAEAINATIEQVTPDYEGRQRRLDYKQLSVAYKSMAAACGVGLRHLPKLHGVGKKKVEAWRWGLEEVPLKAFEDLYYLVQSQHHKLTMERAKELTGLNQTEICRKLGVSPAMGTYWRNAGQIPPAYATRIREWGRC